MPNLSKIKDGLQKGKNLIFLVCYYFFNLNDAYNLFGNNIPLGVGFMFNFRNALHLNSLFFLNIFQSVLGMLCRLEHFMKKRRGDHES